MYIRIVAGWVGVHLPNLPSSYGCSRAPIPKVGVVIRVMFFIMCILILAQLEYDLWHKIFENYEMNTTQSPNGMIWTWFENDPWHEINSWTYDSHESNVFFLSFFYTI